MEKRLRDKLFGVKVEKTTLLVDKKKFVDWYFDGEKVIMQFQL